MKLFPMLHKNFDSQNWSTSISVGTKKLLKQNLIALKLRSANFQTTGSDPDGSAAKATFIGVNPTFRGPVTDSIGQQLTYSDRQDWYSFSVTRTQRRLQIKLVPRGGDLDLKLYSRWGSSPLQELTIFYSDYVDGGISRPDTIGFSSNYVITPGLAGKEHTYYIRVLPGSQTTQADYDLYVRTSLYPPS